MIDHRVVSITSNMYSEMYLSVILFAFIFQALILSMAVPTIIGLSLWKEVKQLDFYINKMYFIYKGSDKFVCVGRKHVETLS